MKWIKRLSYVLAFFALTVFYYIYIYKPYVEVELSRNPETEKQKKTDLNWETQLERARLLTYLHRYDEAELEYRKLLALKPDSILVQGDLATLLYYQGKYQEALNLLKLIPPEQRDDKIKLLIANIYLSIENYEESEKLYREYLQKFPNDLEAQLKLAELLSWQKNYEQSLKLYQDILSKEPNNTQIRRKYALVLVWMGRHSEAAEELKKTLAQEKEVPVNKE